MRALGVILIVSLIGSAQLGCENERQPMSRMPRAGRYQSFLGPIPSDFVNAESRDGVQERLRNLRQRLGSLLAPFLASADQQYGLELADRPQCSPVTDLYGGFVSRSVLQDFPITREATSLEHHNCAEALRAFGSSLPLVVTGLYGQLFRGENIAALRDDECMRFRDVNRLPPRAGFALTIPKQEAETLYADAELLKFRADFDAGATAERLASRGEIEAIVRRGEDRIYQGAALATLYDTDADKLESWRVEMLQHAQSSESRRLWLSSEAVIEYGEPSRITEQTDWTFYRGDVVQREVSLKISIVPVDGGFVVDISQQDADEELKTRLNFARNGDECQVTKF